MSGILANDLLGLSEKWWAPDASTRLVDGVYPGGPFLGAEIVFFAAVESARFKQFTKDGPGAKAFDPAGLAARPDAKTKEIKNGRLASA